MANYSDQKIQEMVAVVTFDKVVCRPEKKNSGVDWAHHFDMKAGEIAPHGVQVLHISCLHCLRICSPSSLQELRHLTVWPVLLH